MFVSVPVMLNNMTTLFRSGLLIIYPLVVLIYKPIDFKKYFTITVLFISTLIWYFISWKVNDQGYISFLFGSYGRNFGILALLGIYVLTILSADNFSVCSADLVKSFYLVLVLAITYGFLQYLKLDPINWEKGAGYGSTLGNPNFSSALLGMLSIIPLTYAFKNLSYKRYIHLLTYVLTLVIILTSGSSQGFVLLIANLLFFIISTNRGGFKISIIKKPLIIFSTLVFASVFLVLRNSNFSLISKSINNNLQIQQRLEHWKLGYRIWLDHPVFGVGLDNLQKYSGEYRNLEMTNWGQYTLPDRSHNVFIDTFVFGGLVTGILYLVFIFFVFIKILRLYKKMKNNTSNNYHVNIFVSIWVTYLMQSMISPDHLLLIACGMMAAGAILGIDMVNQENMVSDAKNNN